MEKAIDMVFFLGQMEKATQVSGKTANMMATGLTLQLMAEKEWVSSEMINLGTSRIMTVLGMLQAPGLKEKNSND